MFTWLYNLLGSMLSFFDSITGSYALALLFYALIFKIVLLPFAIKNQKSQIKRAKLAPKIAIIQAKYKGRTDQPTMQKMNQEIMELQQKEGASVTSGCLPMLIQLPIIMLLYAVIQNPISYIAKNTDSINSYNDNYKEITIETIEDEDIRNKYQAIVEADRKINKADTVLLLYRNFYETSLGARPTLDDYQGDEAKYNEAVKKYEESYNAIVNATSVPSGIEIKLINEINAYVNAYSDPDIKAARIAEINSYGIDYNSFPHFDIFGANMAVTPSFNPVTVVSFIPIFTALIQWLTMFLTRKITPQQNPMSPQQDGQTRASILLMDIPMIALTLWMAYSFSAMLGLYWALQSLLGLAQMFILSAVMPLPKFTAEEIKEYQKKIKEAEKAAKAAAKAQPKHRSLHYIDEDDYDELPEVKSPSNESRPDPKFNDVPDIKD